MQLQDAISLHRLFFRHSYSAYCVSIPSVHALHPGCVLVYHYSLLALVDFHSALILIIPRVAQHFPYRFSQGDIRAQHCLHSLKKGLMSCLVL